MFVIFPVKQNNILFPFLDREIFTFDVIMKYSYFLQYIDPDLNKIMTIDKKTGYLSYICYSYNNICNT